MLAAGAAAEVAGARAAPRRPCIARLVQHEVGVRLAADAGSWPRLALVEVAPLVEQVRAEARARDRLQELLGDDGVGVDVLAVHRGHEGPVCTVKACMSAGLPWRLQAMSPTDVDEVAFMEQTFCVQRGRGGHRRAHQVGAAAGALAAFEVAVAGAGAAFAGLQLVGVHRQAHAAAGFTPLEAGGDLKILCRPSAFGLRLHQARAGHDHRQLDVAGDLAARPLAHHGGGVAQVFDAAVGARADEDLVDAGCR